MKINNYISSFWNRLAVSSLSELVELFGDKIPRPDVPPVRQIRKGIKVRETYEYRDRVFNHADFLDISITVTKFSSNMQ